MPIYNKLIRDHIPDIIGASGKRTVVSILSDEEYLLRLREKCQEELSEYTLAEMDQKRLEELADLLEVMYALARSAEHHQTSWKQFVERRQKSVGLLRKSCFCTQWRIEFGRLVGGIPCESA